MDTLTAINIFGTLAVVFIGLPIACIIMDVIVALGLGGSIKDMYTLELIDNLRRK